MSSSDPSTKPIRKWTPKKPAPGEALPSLFAAAAATSSSTSSFKPKKKPTPTAPKATTTETTTTTDSNLPSLFAAAASISTTPSTTIKKPVASSTTATTTETSTSSFIVNKNKPIIAAKPLVRKPIPPPVVESTGLPTLFQAAANTKPIVKKTPKKNPTANATTESAADVQTDLPQMIQELKSTSTSISSLEENVYPIPEPKTSKQPMIVQERAPTAIPSKTSAISAIPAPTPTTTNPVRASSFSLSSIHIPTVTPSGGPNDSITSELTHPAPISTNVEDVRRVLKAAEQDAESVDTPSSREATESSSLKEKMAEFLTDQKGDDNNDDDDGSVSISSVEVSSSDDDD